VTTEDTTNETSDASTRANAGDVRFVVDTPFSILVVCTGNICRSPALERILSAALGSENGVRIGSAGVQAVTGAPIHPPMAELLLARGIDTSGFMARQLEPELLKEADLVVGFTRRHRAAAVTMYPAAVHHSFTLLELARAVEAFGVEEITRRAGPRATMPRRLKELVPLAVAHRTYVDPELDDIEDPYGREPEVYDRVFRQILVAADPLYRAIIG
jgi:protein-tyrosine phosphatase